MKAVGYRKPGPLSEPEALLDIELPVPVAAGRDLLVEVKAVSVNPVDAKRRLRVGPTEGEFKVLGYDAAGVVRSVGPEVTLFKAGDEVWYAGSILRQGTNAEYHLVDERIVGFKPKTFDFSHAAALPLTSITAWELLFDRFGVERGGKDAGSILVIGGAGGVGSILIQLARVLTGLTVIATASRPETKAWCLEIGAHHVIDHTQPLAPQMQALGIAEAEYIACLTGSDEHYPGVVEVLKPQGKVGMIDEPKAADAKPLKLKCGSLHWEYMFARSTYQTADMQKQHELLNEVAVMVDAGQLKTTFGREMGPMNAANLREAHVLIESGRAQGKIVLTGF